MKWMRIVVLVLALAIVAGCTGGGGGSTSTPPGPAWAKFRHDLANSGQGTGGVVKNPEDTPTPVEILWAKKIDDSPISASPAIGVNNIIFIGSEGGTLAALNPSDGSSLWPGFVDSCDACACPTAARGLGNLTSSPAVYAVNSQNYVFVGSMSGSMSGSVYGFQFEGNAAPTCIFCFQPACTDNTLTEASFASSPSFTINPATSNVAGIFIGATVTDDGRVERGRLYALNADGSIKWHYPSATDATTIGPITSSPAIGPGNTVYFTTDDGFLYALTASGDLLWKTALEPVSTPPPSPSAGLSPSPTPTVALYPSPIVTTTSIIANSANGMILALNADGSFNWGFEPSDGFANSLAIGAPASTATATATSTVGAETPTPLQTPTSLTPTLTPTPGLPSTVVAVDNSGTIWLVNAATGRMPTPCPTRIATPVLSSPALSSDGYVVIGDSQGNLRAISTADCSAPLAWKTPIPLVVFTPGATPGVTASPTPQPIRSSPALDSNGVAYVGSDDGYLYAVGTK